MDLLANIRRKAEQTGQTVEDVERKAELSPRTIRRWNDHAPAFDKVARVANVLGCTVDDLIREEPDADEQKGEMFHASVEEVAKAMNKTPEQLLYEIDHAFDMFKEKQNGTSVKIGDIEITYRKDEPTGEEVGRQIAEEVNKTPKPAEMYYRSVAQ